MSGLEADVENLVEALLELEAACVASRGGAFPDLLRVALEDAERICRTQRHRSLISTRQGSWEAAHIAALFAGVEDDDPDRDSGRNHM